MSQVPENPPDKPAPEKKQLPDIDPQLADEIAKRVANTVGKEKAAIVTAQIVSLFKQERFSGPIAHPRHLREYEEILPGAADRIIRMAESELEHLKRRQMIALEADVEDAKAGRRYGFSALILLITCSLIFGLNGQEVLAGAFLTTGAFGIIGVFLKGRAGNSSGT